MRLSPLSLSPLVFVVLLAACTPATPPTDAPATPPAAMAPEKGVTLTLVKTSSTDELATVHSQVKLQVSGAVEKTVDLGDILGDVMVVDTPAYDLYKKPNGTPILVLTSWWAGSGDEFVITRTEDGLSIQTRSGDELGTCTTLETVEDITLPAGTTVTLAGLGTERTAQSSLKFCAEKDVVGADGVED